MMLARVIAILSLCLFIVNLCTAADFTKLQSLPKRYENKIQTRIVGGKEAQWFHYPWLAKNVCMYNGTNEWVVCGCSSTLIHPRWSVTAGHCLNGPYPYKVGIQFFNGAVVEVEKEVRHPDFSRDSLNLKNAIGIVSDSTNDIGLQYLKHPATQLFLPIFQDKDLDGNIVGVEAKLLGWGATQNDQVFLPGPEGFSATLQQIDEIVQDNDVCQGILNLAIQILTDGALDISPFQFTSNLMCATPKGMDLTLPPTSAPEGLCRGDSGGPIFRTSGWFWREVHILGFVTDTLSLPDGRYCGNGVDIYTRFTQAYLDWIRSVVFPPSNTN